MTDRKSKEEVELSNRRFAVGEAVKLTYPAELGLKPIDHAREFFAFLQENPDIPEITTGFTIPERD